MIGSRLAQYEITKHLGSGGMGDVYQATDSKLNRSVAIKFLPEAFADDTSRVARFEREARVLASLNHPNIATLYGLEDSGGRSFLVMELVPGQTLAERISRGPIELDEALAIAAQIADALESAHEKGVVHRDLKPANVKITPEGRVKVLDFGLARAFEPDTDVGLSTANTVKGTATQHGVVLGTAAYMPPEQARGQNVDKRADIWAFGVVLLEMLTGRNPFSGETFSDTLASVLRHEPDIDAAPVKVRRLIRRCLEKDPRRRLRDIGDAMALVEPDQLTDLIVPVKPKTSRVLSALVALLVIALVTTIWLWFKKPAGETTGRTMRFFVDTPAGTAFNFTFTGTAISPDGRFLVFRSARGIEPAQLWLRPLDSLTARPLPGTEDGDFPFWSPDSKSVGFFARGKLKKLEIAGGVPLTLCDASSGDVATNGASWNRDGIILFGGSAGLRRVPESGGVPEFAAQVKADRKETGYGIPQFLPDGKRFLFFIRTEDRSKQGIYASSLDRPQEASLVLAADHKVIYVPSGGGRAGYLLFLRGQTLMAQPFDAGALRLEGAPVPVAEEVALFPQLVHASFWASDNGVLVYRTGASDTPKLTWFSRDGKRLGDTGAAEFSTYVRLSPDASKAVVEIPDSTTGNINLWSWDFVRGLKTRRTFDSQPDRAPAWSPDGRQIVFSSAKSGVFQIYRRNLEGGEEEQLTAGSTPKWVSDWSRDGRYVLFDDGGYINGEDIWAVQVDGKDSKNTEPFAVVKTSFPEFSASLSPDGKWVAYNSTDTGRPEIYVQAFQPGRSAGEAPAPRWQISDRGGRQPRWRGDSKELFFVGLDGSRILSATIRATATSVESDNPHQLFVIPIMLDVRSPYDVTADGQRFLVLERTISQATPLAVILDWQEALNK